MSGTEAGVRCSTGGAQQHRSLPPHSSGNAAFASQGNHQEQLQCLVMLSIHTTGIFNLHWGLGISPKNSFIFLLKLSDFYYNSDK